MKLLCSLFALAAVLSLTAEPPVAELSNLTATAILGWYAWHTATRTIPQLVEDFRGELAILRAQQHCELTAQRAQHRADRDAFLHEMADQRVQRHADHVAIVEAVDDLQSIAQRLSIPDPNN